MLCRRLCIIIVRLRRVDNWHHTETLTHSYKQLPKAHEAPEAEAMACRTTCCGGRRTQLSGMLVEPFLRLIFDSARHKQAGGVINRESGSSHLISQPLVI